MKLVSKISNGPLDGDYRAGIVKQLRSLFSARSYHGNYDAMMTPFLYLQEGSAAAKSRTGN
jgi:hypothetical protein